MALPSMASYQPMNPSEPISQSMLTKTCRDCGATFQTEIWWNKDYCNVRCRMRARRKREKAATVTVRNAAVEAESHRPIVNPSIAQLNAVAQALVTGAQVNPKLFAGAIPMWTPPAGVEWMQDHEDKTMWVMGKA